MSGDVQLDLSPVSPGEAVREWRKSIALTQTKLGEMAGLSKSKISELESGEFRPGVGVALKIESLSNGRIDAADLSDDVKAARHGLETTDEPATPSTGKAEQSSDGRERCL